jgi:macrolide transport system ATP-binding/permease protein
MLDDLRFALRLFARNKGAAAVAVISLAIAIGPNVALFSVADRLILKPPAIQGISQMFYLWTYTDRGKLDGLSYPDVPDYQAQAGDIASFAAFDRRIAAVNFGGHQEMVPMHPVSPNYFSFLGANAAVGRTLLESDAHFEGQPPAVISYSLWQRHYAGTTDVVGKPLFVNERPFSIVGVMPRGFREPGMDPLPPALWIPFSSLPPGDQQYLMQRGSRGILTMVRLRPDVDKTHAEALLTIVASRLAKQYPDTNKGKTVSLDNPEDKGPLAVIVLSLAGLVLLVACANITGILVAQGEARRQELAVRVAMGASRLRLMRQLIAETMLLSLMAGGMGVVLARWLIEAIPALNPFTMFTLDFDFSIDNRVLAYTLGLALLATLAASFAPSFRFSRPDLVPSLKGDAPTSTRRFRLRGGLVIAQIAFSQFLMVGTALLVRSYLQIQEVRPGFDPDRKVLTVMIEAPAEKKFIDLASLADKVRALPGVVRVSFANALPLSGTGESTKSVFIPGAMPQPIDVGWKAVGPDYLTIMGTRLVRGRDFGSHDAKGSVVVNETMARQLWGGPDAAMGKVFRADGEDLRVLGVVENGKYVELREKPMPFMFIAVPIPRAGHGSLLVETAAAPLSVARSVQDVIRDTQPDAVVMSINTLRQDMRLALFGDRVAAGFVGIIAMLGMFLAGVGLYGLVSYSVTRRTHEIGIRMVMGATSANVLSMVIRESLTRVAIGAVIGLAAALAAARIVASALYHVSPADPVGVAAAVLAVGAIGLLAVYAPARRALRVDPMTALRQE